MRRWLILSAIIIALGLAYVGWTVWQGGELDRETILPAIIFVIAAAILIPARSEIQRKRVEKQLEKRSLEDTFE